MKIKMRDYEQIVNNTVNQIIFTNVHGDTEYHPEREDFLLDYFYLKYFVGHEFKVDYTFESDIFDLEFYQDLSDEIDIAMTEDIYNAKVNDIEFCRIKRVIHEKIDFLKNSYFKKNSYGLTDVYLAEFVSKITYWLEDNGIDKFLEVVSKTGEELGNQELQGTKSKAKRGTREKHS